MRRTWVIVLVVGLAIGGGILYRTRPGPPAGQPPLVEITVPALAALQTEFNRASSSLRIILLLSPT